MDLLKAVNTVLPYLGEHVITRIAGTRHPTVDLIIAAIDRQRLTLLAAGYWFNEVHQTLPVNTNGQIDVPTGTITLYGCDFSVSMEDGKVYDLCKNTRYFTAPLRVKIIRDITFDNLPVQVALYITYLAATELYLADYGVEAVVQELKAFAAVNKMSFGQENLRNRRYNNRTVANRDSSYNRLRWR